MWSSRKQIHFDSQHKWLHFTQNSDTLPHPLPHSFLSNAGEVPNHIQSFSVISLVALPLFYYVCSICCITQPFSFYLYLFPLSKRESACLSLNSHRDICFLLDTSKWLAFLPVVTKSLRLSSQSYAKLAFNDILI